MDPVAIANLAMTGIGVAMLGLGAWQKRRKAAGKPQLLPDLSGAQPARPVMPMTPDPMPLPASPPATPPLVAPPVMPSVGSPIADALINRFLGATDDKTKQMLEMAAEEVLHFALSWGVQKLAAKKAA